MRRTAKPISNRARAHVGTALIKLLGRRSLARAGRYLSNVARLDVVNDIDTNGELLVQSVVISNAPHQDRVTVFDIGANVGDWTIPLLRTCADIGRTNVEVHSFEPIASSMRRLESNTSQVETTAKLLLVMKAVSDATGRATMSVVDECCGVNAMTPDPKQPIQFVEAVDRTTIDQYCRETGITEVSLVKVDTEGHDLAVLRGAQKMLAERRIQLVQFEYNWRWIFSRAYLLDVFQLAEKVGYRLGKITPSAIEFYDDWNFELETFREGNYLLCLPDWVTKFPRVEWWNSPSRSTRVSNPMAR